MMVELYREQPASILKVDTSTFSLRSFDRPRIPTLAADRPHRIFTARDVPRRDPQRPVHVDSSRPLRAIAAIPRRRAHGSKDSGRSIIRIRLGVASCCLWLRPGFGVKSAARSG
jgi:hypothetical protein